MKVWDGRSGLLEPEDIVLIKEVVLMLPPEPVLVMDLGAGSGTTALSVLTARNKDIHVLSVDIAFEAIDNTKVNMIQYGFIDKWSGFVSRGDKAPYKLNMGLNKVDFLMDDCSHDYASQQDTLNAWIPFLRPHAKIWIHDAWDEDNKYPGVRRAVEEFVLEGILKTYKTLGFSWAGELA